MSFPTFVGESKFAVQSSHSETALWVASKAYQAVAEHTLGTVSEREAAGVEAAASLSVVWRYDDLTLGNQLRGSKWRFKFKLNSRIF
ncbi:hypothetical protein MKY48_17410 [Paenibacillus sp. FSL W8-0187]|uniref:hypothetical protein n=1 Tax=unclassified Paenibacillus TaxID=185978 RepID=UPI0030DC9899